jgi:large subunit ribosomal protein L18
MLNRRQKALKNRQARIRKSMAGSQDTPRLRVTRSLNHLEAQFIDDVSGKTLLGLSTRSKAVRERVSRGNREGSKALGEIIGQMAKAKKIEAAIFDRGGCLYHGRIKEFADAVRKTGIKF